MKKRTFLEASPNATKPASKRRKVELEDDDPPAGDDGNDAKRDGKITAKNAARPTGRPRKRIKAQPIDNDNDKKEGDLEQSSPARKAKANAQSSPKPASKRGQKAASPKAYKSSGKETKQTTPKAESKDEGKQSKRSGSTKKASPEESEKGQNKWKRFHKPRTVTPDPLDCRLPRRFELLSPAVKALDSGSVLRLKRVPRMTAEESAACLHVLDTISAIEDADIFFEPVNPVALRIPHYRRIVKHPLSFSELRWRLSRHGYGSIKAFVVELRHVFDNCWTFNPPGNEVNQLAHVIWAAAKAELLALKAPVVIDATWLELVDARRTLHAKHVWFASKERTRRKGQFMATGIKRKLARRMAKPPNDWPTFWERNALAKIDPQAVIADIS